MSRADWMPASELERVRKQERQRQRRRRARLREHPDLACLPISVPRFATADRLVEQGRLAEWDSDDRAALVAALTADVLSRVTPRDDGEE